MGAWEDEWEAEDANWGEVTWGLRLKLQSAKFVFYLIGAIPRVFLLGFVIFSVEEIKYRPLRGIVYLAACLVLMGFDARRIFAKSTEGLGAVSGPKRIVYNTLGFALYLFGLAFHSFFFILTVAGGMFVWDRTDRTLGVIITGAILAVVGLGFLWAISQRLTEPKGWLRGDHFAI